MRTWGSRRAASARGRASHWYCTMPNRITRRIEVMNGPASQASLDDPTSRFHAPSVGRRVAYVGHIDRGSGSVQPRTWPVVHTSIRIKACIGNVPSIHSSAPASIRWTQRRRTTARATVASLAASLRPPAGEDSGARAIALIAAPADTPATLRRRLNWASFIGDNGALCTFSMLPRPKETPSVAFAPTRW
jgi:hypothetical protein